MKRGVRAAPRYAISSCLVLLGVLAPAVADAYPDAVGARPLAMGQAGHADARGTDALALNPAGMSLATLYAIAADYQMVTKSGGQTIRVAIADSTSASGLAGGLYYGYRAISPTGAPSLHAHEAGLALAYPFVDRVFLGATAKYLWVNGGTEPDGSDHHTGFTVDVGMALRASPMLTLGVTGHNLVDRSTTQAPVALGYGLAFTPRPELSVVFDVLHDFRTSYPNAGTRTSVGGGAEIVIQGFLAARVGGGRDGASQAGFVSGGLAGISPVGALDASIRQDLSGDRRLTTLVFGFRLFVESPNPRGGGASSSGDSSGSPSSSPPSGSSPSFPSLPPGAAPSGPAPAPDVK
ncbi:MAG TPA: hypothetical protein VIU64_08605 [Polyangia bacterium]